MEARVVFALEEQNTGVQHSMTTSDILLKDKIAIMYLRCLKSTFYMDYVIIIATSMAAARNIVPRTNHVSQRKALESANGTMTTIIRRSM